MKPSQLKLLKQFDPSRKSYGGTVSVSYPSWVLAEPQPLMILV